MIHVPSSEKNKCAVWEGVEFVQHIKAGKKPDFICLTYDVPLCNIAYFGEYHTKKLLNMYAEI